MTMEIITSRQNQYVVHCRRLSIDGNYRRATGEYICDGMKMFKEALLFGAEVRAVICLAADISKLPAFIPRYVVSEDLMQYLSPLKNSSGPVFTVKIPDSVIPQSVVNLIILDGVQDPGNVGTVIRTANAFGIDLVILTGNTADLYNPKAVRATMGAVFRQPALSLDYGRIDPLIKEYGLTLYGATLSENAIDIRNTDLKNAAVAIGSEGGGLSPDILNMCDQIVMIPMCPDSESLNAAVAAAVVMWELYR